MPSDTMKTVNWADATPLRPAVHSSQLWSAGNGCRPLRIGFIMEQVLGNVTWYLNLRSAISGMGGVDARWVDTSLYNSRGLLERLPGVPSYVRGGARGWLDTHRGLRGWSSDVLLFNTQKPAIFCQWDMLRTPTILMTDLTPRQFDRLAVQYDDDSVDGNAAVTMIKHQTNVLNFRLARAVIPWSTWVRESLIREYGLPPARIHVIPPGVDTQRWCPGGARRGTDRVQLLFVGGNFERKGGRLLLDVFRSLGLHDRADLHIATRDAVQPSPGVVVHRDMQNNSQELVRLYQQADVFVLPTLADTFSLVSLEAMAVGLPVVISGLAGIPDIVEPGRTGYLLPPGDGRKLGEVLLHLIDDAQTRRAFGVAGRERALARFDACTNAARIVELARHVSAEAGRAPTRELLVGQQ